MSHRDDQVPREPDERMERREVIERTEVEHATRPRGTTPMWVWVLPLVLIVIVLAWYVLSTGQPDNPVDNLPGIGMMVP